MKQKKILYPYTILISVLCIFFIAPVQCEQLIEKKIVIITASYNNQKWYAWNLDSIFEQNYTNYTVIYINDNSSDDTGKLVERYIEEHNQQHRVSLINNKTRRLTMANQYDAIHSCDDNDIIMIVDGDDKLAHKNVLAYINAVYSDPNIWLTYGQFIEYPTNVRGFCAPMPADVVRNNSFRSYTHIPSHLRTFYARLFKKIKKEDLMYENDFIPMAPDMAAMIPMIEMARDHFAFIPVILYTYNAINIISEHRVSKELQRNMDLYIRSKPRYTPLTTLFN